MIDLKTSAAVRPAPMGEVESYEAMLREAEHLTPDLPAVPEQTAPKSAKDAYRSSWKAMLADNVGRSVIVSFLMGTQNTVVAEGELYEVGSDYIVLYQPVRDSYITADLYCVKFVEFPAAGGQCCRQDGASAE